MGTAGGNSSVPGRGNSKGKDHEPGLCSVSMRNRKEASVCKV